MGCGVKKSIYDRPQVDEYKNFDPEVTKHNDSAFSYEKNYLIKNQNQQWELYVEGAPYQRGKIIGVLADSILKKQESVFFEKIKEIVPSEKKQKRLRNFLKYYNRKMYKHVPEEFKKEIYGLSGHMNDEYDDIAPPYLRALYLHAAHDIGHALEDLAMVECTSVALWGANTNDGELLIGRNFDFYAGDEFAEEKLISFIKPDSGIPFMSVSWPGMVGVVSGMNVKGLTVTINAGKSSIPFSAKKPISILCREILQYASNIEEAIKIAEKSDVFVSESIMVGSNEDNKAVLIEISPKKLGVFELNNSPLVCSNHFQSETYKKDRRNNQHIENSHSQYRWDRMQELVSKKKQMTYKDVASILRNKKGIDDESIGFGNEKSLNQLMAHHAVIFKPASGIVWVSSAPYQLGAFTAYDLNKIFNSDANFLNSNNIDSLKIEMDDFVYSDSFSNYEKYREYDRKVDQYIKNEQPISQDSIDYYINLNPDLWSVYYKSGLMMYHQKEYEVAQKLFETSLKKEITTLDDKERVLKYLKKAERKAK